MPAASPLLLLPFALLLGSMAVAPAVAPRWWERHYAKIALALGAVTLGYYLFGLRATAQVLHTGHEYVSFIVLVGSLFVVSGGIHLQVKDRATPWTNVIFLLAGAVAANIFGTTGAAMLLIRPWIRMNRARMAAHHVVFFIFIVANIGGCLTPIGDPPLFLGYLQGVPFWWIAKNCWPMWLAGVGALLAIFYAVDKVHFVRASDPGPVPGSVREAWKFDGAHNLFFLAIILSAVFFGAATYIGNGPNFMVKAVAEQQGVRPPGFLAFIFKFTLPFLLPVLAVVWWAFFRS